jgi:small subunit ribosomal protein S16
MDEPKEGATTLKKKAQEKLAAKANPVSEEVAVVEETVVATHAAEEAVVETPAVEEVVAETPAVEEAVVETPAETPAAEAAAE